VEGVGFDHQKQTVVVLKDWENKKLLPIWIGAAEARSIALHLEGATMPRPLSHDLILSCIAENGGRVTRVVINDLQEGTYYATIDIDTPGGILHIDSRPSDAIAVAVRAQCPLFVAGAVMNELIDIAPDEDEANTNDPMTDQVAGSQTPKPTDEELERFRRLVGDLEL
jgi:bifunctional DNase/RNase